MQPTSQNPSKSFPNTLKSVAKARNLLALAGLAICPVANANILTLNYGSDNSSALNCQYYSWNQAVLSMNGNQFLSGGSLSGSLTTDTPADPTLTLSSAINNDSAFAWTGYKVNVFMNQTFTLSSAIVTTPGNWTGAITQPVLTGGQYVGEVDYLGGTPVAVNGLLNFSFTMTFAGSTQYSFTEQVVAVPEPGALAFLTLVGAALAWIWLSRPVPVPARNPRRN